MFQYLVVDTGSQVYPFVTKKDACDAAVNLLQQEGNLFVHVYEMREGVNVFETQPVVEFQNC